MTLGDFVSAYGYLAVFVGSLLEGETILVLGGFAAHQQRLDLPVVLLVAFVGGTLGDQVFYRIGRAFGPQLFGRWPALAQRTLRLGVLLQRHDAAAIVGVRFMYGLRIAGPIAMGALGVAPWRFALFNMLGAAIWACLIGGLGYLFGQALEALVGDLQTFEETILAVVVGSVVVFALARRGMRWMRRRRAADASADQEPNA